MTLDEYNRICPNDVLIKKTNGFKVRVVRIDRDLECVISVPVDGASVHLLYEWEAGDWDLLLRA